MTTQPTIQTHTDHVTPATARKLADLGAFKDRGLRAGDWVFADGTDWIIQGGRDCLFGAYRPNDDLLRPIFYSTGVMREEYDCLFLPRLTDLLDELERVCSTEDGCEVPTLMSGDRFLKWQCSIFDRQRTRMGHSFGTTREEAAANCLISVLEGRK